MAASARRYELGETHGEQRPVRHAERRRGVCCAPASGRPRRFRERRLVATACTEESSSSDYVLYLSYVRSEHGRERTVV